MAHPVGLGSGTCSGAQDRRAKWHGGVCGACSTPGIVLVSRIVGLQYLFGSSDRRGAAFLKTQGIDLQPCILLSWTHDLVSFDTCLNPG